MILFYYYRVYDVKMELAKVSPGRMNSPIWRFAVLFTFGSMAACDFVGTMLNATLSRCSRGAPNCWCLAIEADSRDLFSNIKPVSLRRELIYGGPHFNASH